jgi:hypothetical protein
VREVKPASGTMKYLSHATPDGRATTSRNFSVNTETLTEELGKIGGILQKIADMTAGKGESQLPAVNVYPTANVAPEFYVEPTPITVSPTLSIGEDENLQSIAKSLSRIADFIDAFSGGGIVAVNRSLSRKSRFFIAYVHFVFLILFSVMMYFSLKR